MGIPSDKHLFYTFPAFILLSFCVFSLANVYFFHVYDWDFSFFLTQPWRIWNGWDAGVPFDMDIEGDVFWAHHLCCLGFVIAPIIGLFPSPFTLAMLHAISLGSIAFIIPHLVSDIYHCYASVEMRDKWRWTTFFILLIFNFFMPLLGPLNYPTHYTTLVSPFIALALLFMHRNRWKYVWICAFIVCLAQERSMVSLFGLGMYAFLIRKEKKKGIILCLISIFLFFTSVKVILPFLRYLAGYNETYFFLKLLGPFDLLYEKLVYIISCLICLIFLPLFSSQALIAFLCASPTISIWLVSKNPGGLVLKSQYLDIAVPFFLCSIIFGLIKIQKISSQKAYKIILCSMAVIYITGFCLTPFKGCQPIFGTIFLSTSTFAPEHHLMRKEVQVFDSFPDAASLYAQSGLGPQMSLHKNRYSTLGDLDRASREASLVVYSKYASPYIFKERDWDKDIDSIERIDNIQMLCNTGRLRIYASDKMRIDYPEYITFVKTTLPCAN